ncbi:MAG: mechanosensitive ion channel domain-containing protein [Spartobacteria bacterium]
MAIPFHFQKSLAAFVSAILLFAAAHCAFAQSPTPQPPAEPDYQSMLDAATAEGFAGFSRIKPATEDEYREYLHLLSQIVEMRTMLQDDRESLEIVRGRTEKILSEIESFKPPEATPETSLGLYDQARLNLWQAEHWISALEKIGDNRAAQASKAFDALKSAQQKLQFLQNGGQPGNASQSWQLELQQTRVAAALAEQSVRANTSLWSAELDINKARQQLAGLQAAALKPAASFPGELLQSLMDGFDKDQKSFDAQIAQIEARLKSFSTRNPAADDEALTSILVECAQYEIQFLDYRRVLLMVRSQILQGRFDLWNSTDGRSLDRAAQSISDRAQDVLVWQPLIAGFRTRFEQRRDKAESLLAARPQPVPAAISDFAGKSLEKEAAALSAWENDYSAITQLITLCNADADAKRKDLGLAKNLDAAAGTLAAKAAAIWNTSLFTLSDSVVVNGKVVQSPSSVTLGMVIIALAILIAGGIASASMSRWLRARITARMQLDANTGVILEKFTYYLLLIVVCLIALAVVRIPITIFALLGGAAAIAVGFGGQQLVNNLISGFILLFERPIRIGDEIDVGTYSGTVTAVGTRCCRLHRADGVEILIPNSIILQSAVSNHTLSDPFIRREIHVNLAYGAPIEKAMELILGILKSHPDILKSKDPVVFLSNFGPDAIDLHAMFWVDQNTPGSGTRVPSEIRLSIYNALNSAGISFGLATPRRVQP